jgi:predicted ATPase
MLPYAMRWDKKTVGSVGENIVDFMEKYMGQGLCVPPALARGESNVEHNIVQWLREISPGVDFSIVGDPNMLAGTFMFNGHSAFHSGFGLSYALPIIASVLVHSAQLQTTGKGIPKSVLLMVEYPEAHLHPSAQTKMGKLLALAAACGVQIVAETHSDHLLNGVRLAIKEGGLACDDAKVFYFRAGKGDAPSSVEPLNIDKFGMLDHWPDGFFDEAEKSLIRLL